jgi:hypothetical protein
MRTNSCAKQTIVIANPAIRFRHADTTRPSDARALATKLLFFGWQLSSQLSQRHLDHTAAKVALGWIVLGAFFLVLCQPSCSQVEIQRERFPTVKAFDVQHFRDPPHKREQAVGSQPTAWIIPPDAKGRKTKRLWASDARSHLL